MTVRCMETVVSKYEDQVRFERERRNEKTWDFCSYLLFQVLFSDEFFNVLAFAISFLRFICFELK